MGLFISLLWCLKASWPTEHARKACTHKQSPSSKKNKDVLISTKWSILVPSLQGYVDAAYPYTKLFSPHLPNLFSIYFLCPLPHTHPYSKHTSFCYRRSNSNRKHKGKGKKILRVEKQNAITWIKVLTFEDEFAIHTDRWAAAERGKGDGEKRQQDSERRERLPLIILFEAPYLRWTQIV